MKSVCDILYHLFKYIINVPHTILIIVITCPSRDLLLALFFNGEIRLSTSYLLLQPMPLLLLALFIRKYEIIVILLFVIKMKCQ